MSNSKIIGQSKTIFKHNYIVGINKKSRNLVSEVSATIFNSIMNLCNYFTFPTAFFAAFWLFAQASLSSCQTFFIGLEKARIVYFYTGAQGQKSGYSGITANDFICLVENLFRSFNRKAGKPLSAGIFTNRQRFNLADYCAVKFDFKFSNLGKRQSVIGNREPALSKGQGIVTASVLKSRKTGFSFLRFYSTKEILKGFLNPFQNVLRDLRMNVFIFGIGFFDFLELIGLVVIVQRNSIKFVGISSLLKRCVIQISAQIERLFEFGYLCLARKNAKTETFLDAVRSHLPSTQLVGYLIGIREREQICLESASVLSQHKAKTRVDTRPIHHQFQSQLEVVLP